MYKPIIQPIARDSKFPILEYGENSFVLKNELIQKLRTLSYLEQWKTLTDSKSFHIKMADHSLFIFGEGARPSYSYMQCPLDVTTFPEYLISIGEEDNPTNRNIHREDYYYALETASERKHCTPIRFDYDERGYTPGVHPAAHIHIGLSNQIRIGCNKMTPLSFVLFIMRQAYPSCWERLINKRNSKKIGEMIRSENTRINAEHYQELDKVELHCK